SLMCCPFASVEVRRWWRHGAPAGTVGGRAARVKRAAGVQFEHRARRRTGDMGKRLGWALLAWDYVAYGVGGPYPPQLFGPLLSEEQCVAQANDWSARGVASICLKSEIQGLPSYGGAVAYPPAPPPGSAAAPVTPPPGKTPLMAPNQPMKK